MHDSGARQSKGPIFVVGSPRSGTSILTWCLGQHANILPQEESGWMGDFAVSLDAHHKVGYKRGARSQLSAMGIDQAEFFKSMGDGINHMILRHRSDLEERSRSVAEQDPTQVHTAFNVSKFSSDPKTRWVDGTPEYSLYICGLKKLFPDARFIHIVRDVQSVVNSMMHFSSDLPDELVKSEREAYEYWMRAVRACAQAERALGKQQMFRLRYEDLVKQPASAMRSVLEFLDEPFMIECIGPLLHRINSSNVPLDYSASECETNAIVVNQALQLSEKMQQPFIAEKPSARALAEFEATFEKRATYVAQLDAEYGLLLAITNKLLHGLNWCGIAIAGNMLGALLFGLTEIFLLKTHLGRSTLLWMIFATAGASIYVKLRKTGFRNLAAYAIRLVTLNRFSVPPAKIK